MRGMIFLAVLGRPEEPEKRTEPGSEVLMAFLQLVGRPAVTVDALRHVLGRCAFH